MLTPRKQFIAISFVLCFMTSAGLADVTRESTTKMDFKGALGTIIRLFGGEKPVTTIDYVKDNVHRSDQVDKKGKPSHSTIIDLDKETFTTVDYGRKEFTIMTFEQWRRMMAENLRKLQETKGEKSTESSEEPGKEVEWSFDMKVNQPGDSKEISGYRTRKAIIELTVGAEVTEQPEDGGEAGMSKGGLKVTSENWLTTSLAGKDEIVEFTKRLAEKLGMDPAKDTFSQIMSTVMQNNPQLGAAMDKMQEESAKLEGVALDTHTVFEGVGEEKQVSEQKEEQPAIPTSVGGLLKGFGKKDKKKENENILLETTTIVKKYDTSTIGEDITQIPAKFKEKPYKAK